jgi:hypothetical protein
MSKTALAPRSALGNFVRHESARAKKPAAPEQHTNIGDRYMCGNPAAQSTIEALMYSLRSGAALLSRNDVQQQLATIDEKQLQEVCARLQNFKIEIAKAWSDEEVERLVMTWTECHAR